MRDPAVRAPGCGALKRAHNNERELGVEHYIQLALASDPSGILVILDADAECLERDRVGGGKLGPDLLRRARSVARGVPVEVVIANREFEVWFLADVRTLRSKGFFASTKRAGLDKGMDIESLPGSVREKLRSCSAESTRLP